MMFARAPFAHSYSANYARGPEHNISSGTQNQATTLNLYVDNNWPIGREAPSSRLTGLLKAEES
eukprot:9501805-Pyramimonas_sp.AAC.1